MESHTKQLKNYPDILNLDWHPVLLTASLTDAAAVMLLCPAVHYFHWLPTLTAKVEIKAENGKLVRPPHSGCSECFWFFTSRLFGSGLLNLSAPLVRPSYGRYTAPHTLSLQADAADSVPSLPLSSVPFLFALCAITYQIAFQCIEWPSKHGLN